MEEKKIAMLGGSFDPIHLGHLFLLHCAVNQTKYNHFILIPAKISNFKLDSAPKASDKARLEMLSLALEDYRDLYPDDKATLEISTCELDRGGISYTYDTVMDLKARYCIDGRLGLVMGDDHVKGLSSWYRFQDLKDQVSFVICRREDSQMWDYLPAGIDYEKILVDQVAPQSSSAVRGDLGAFASYLSPRVLEYVKANGLYL